jgi:hypothetical protein
MRRLLIAGLLSLAWATSVHAIDTTYKGKDLRNMSPSEVERVLGRGKQEAGQESGLCPNRKMDIWSFPGGPGKIVRAGFCAQKGLVSLVVKDGVLPPDPTRPPAKTAAERKAEARLRAEEGKYEIEYVVECAYCGVSLTYQNAQGGTEQREATLGGREPWIKRLIVRRGANLYISAQSVSPGFRSITAKILVEGVEVKSSNSSGEYVIATASGRL